MHDRLTVGSLFSGIGGIDLGLERAGMVTRWFVEWDAHCQNVLRRHWPGLPVYGDITAVDWSGVEPVDVLAGGFPCQPVSVAGRALAQADERWLWPSFRDAIGALRPRYVLVENVPGLLQRGLGIVLGDLAELGYDAEWECIPAAAVGAPHLRNRLWLIAYRTEQRWTLADADDGRPRDTLRAGRAAAGNGGTDDVADADRSFDGASGAGEAQAAPAGQFVDAGASRGSVAHPNGPERHERRQHRARSGEGAGHVADSDGNAGDEGRAGYTSQEPRRRNPNRSGSRTDDVGHPNTHLDGTSGAGATEAWSAGFAFHAGTSPPRNEQWTTEPDVGRVAHGVPHRVDRLRALGNAVVPQVVEWIGARIVAFDEGRVTA